MLILEFLVKRIAQGLLIVFITSLIIFTLLRVVPGDPVRLIVGGMAPPDVVEKVATKMGLRDPIIVQYGRYMRRLLRGDLGQSYQRPRSGMISPGGQLLLVSIHSFWLAIVLILFLSVKLKLLPALGYQGFSYVLLPALVLSVEIAPFIIRTLTTSLGEVMQATFIDEARVRGLSRRRIVFSHPLRNAAVPLVNLPVIPLSTMLVT